ncbi:MAG: hypothetical protein K2P78_05410 [Gemmataceae bacterium]|nr:hypothetical protein [Gemmataceae bacterium]
MRLLLSGLILACAGGLVSARDDDDDEPMKYTNKEGKFAVAFPGNAKPKKQTQDASGIQVNIFMVDKGDQAYAVMYMLLPEGAEDLPAKTLLDGGQKGAVEKSGAKLIRAKDMNFGPKKLPAREVLVEKDGNQLRAWLIVDGRRVYLVLVGGPEEFASGKEATAFLKSFEITK